MTDHELLQAIYKDTQEQKQQIQDIYKDTQEQKQQIQDIYKDTQEQKQQIQAIYNDTQEQKQQIQAIYKDTQDLKQRVSNVENKVTNIELTLENEISINIKRVAEGHLDLSRNLHDALKIDCEKEMMAIRINTLENELRKIKERLNQTA